MFHTAEDGSAIVSAVPIPPFVPLQHQQINVATVNHLANYSLRMARERGWLQTPEDMRKATEAYASNDARPLLEQEGYAHKGDDLTFFYAGVEASLAARQPHFHYPPVPSTLLLWCRFYVAHVGSSSYSLYGELYTYLEGKEDHTRQLLGHFKVTTVQVSKTLRTVQPLPPARRALIAAACESSKAHLSELAPAGGASITRLDVRGLLIASGMVVNAERADFNQLTLCSHAGSRYGDTVLATRFRKVHALRASDMDFNFHVNQLAMQQLVLNTFRAALRDDKGGNDGDAERNGQLCGVESVYPRLLNANVMPVVGDLLLRTVRIDYVREIPMTHEATEICLFPIDDASLERMAMSKPGARLDALAEIGFFTCGAPALARPERFLATVGTFSCYV